MTGNLKKNTEAGQSLLELVVVVALSILVISALVVATILSIRNSNFSKNQTQATKLAQEGLERLRTIRDQDKDGGQGSIRYPVPPPQLTITKFSGLWNINLDCGIGSGNCYFSFNQEGVLVNGAKIDVESTINPGGFKRSFEIVDDTDRTCAKKVTAIVKWEDSAGSHESRLSTILRNNSCGA